MPRAEARKCYSYELIFLSKALNAATYFEEHAIFFKKVVRQLITNITTLKSANSCRLERHVRATQFIAVKLFKLLPIFLCFAVLLMLARFLSFQIVCTARSS